MKKIILITITSVITSNAGCYFNGIPYEQYWFNIKIRELKANKKKLQNKINYLAVENERLRLQIKKYKEYKKVANKKLRRIKPQRRPSQSDRERYIAKQKLKEAIKAVN